MKMLPRRSQMTRMTETTSIDRLNRVELYPDRCGDCINIEVIWKCSQTSETIDQDDRRLSQKSSLSFDLDTAEAENNFKMFALRMGTI